MLKIDKLLSAPHGIAPVLVRRAPKLILPFAERSKSRLRAVLDNGDEAALFLPRGTVLRGGDLLVTEDGSFVEVQAATEAVLEVRAQDPHALMRAAYHLGNRHTPVEIGRDYLRLEYDPVLADMLQRLGVRAERAELPFEPEAGAYGGGHKHGHDATFAEDYAAAQAVFHEHHGHDHGHSHGPSHGHGHSHDHGDPHHVHDEHCGHKH
ncbi:Urease accessory protein UreE [Cupriavidus necator H850]|jgi:urease accessory protein|uniref:urease accessory protein UreE n=1 Tax=Cupriavidus TaxID=106589 RepID=UPI00129EBA59|nr:MULTISPECIES: urease accessory protein UreE [Cupriavidus]KAI3596263.1 Urease accessory protein UreE [Cupriavidus necator H850]QUN29387.1 urease accessory protein UreE [Cupriavidus sp. KK10]